MRESSSVGYESTLSTKFKPEKSAFVRPLRVSLICLFYLSTRQSVSEVLPTIAYVSAGNPRATDAQTAAAERPETGFLANII